MIFLTESDGCFPIWFNNIAKRFLPLRPAKRRSQLGPWPTRPDCPETLPGQKTVFKTSFPTIINNHWIGLRDIVQETIIHRIYMYLLLNLGVSCKLSLKPIQQETHGNQHVGDFNQAKPGRFIMVRSIGIVAQVWKRWYLLFRITRLWGQVDQIGWCLKVNQNRFSLLHVIRIFPSKVCSPQGSNETSRHKWILYATSSIFHVPPCLLD